MEKYYDENTKNALENFDISKQIFEKNMELVEAICVVKRMAVISNYESKSISQNKMTAILMAIDKILKDNYAESFPLDIIQGGAYTSLNINVNEVIANISSEFLNENVDAFDDVNMSQSTNDVIPSAMKLLFLYKIINLKNELKKTMKIFNSKIKKYDDVIKLGRTCLREALPMQLNDQLKAYRVELEKADKKLANCEKICQKLAIGGTAIGTSYMTRPNYIENFYKELNNYTGKCFKPAKSFFHEIASGQDFGAISEIIKNISSIYNWIAKDFKLMSTKEFGEINLEYLQKGSSIMPGKVNPVMCELMSQVYYIISGNNLSVSLAVDNKELQLNVNNPTIYKCISESFELMTNSIIKFNEKCLNTFTVNKDRCKYEAENSIALSTVVSYEKGYNYAQDISIKSIKNKRSIKEECRNVRLYSDKEREEKFDVTNIAKNSR